MKKIYLIIFIIFFNTDCNASIKNKILNNLYNINNVVFNFEQNIKNKIETGNCILQYPKKIFCKYKLKNKKILVSNGNSLVIKTLNSYYIYPLNKTPLNLILDKNYLMNKIENLNERVIDGKFINFQFFENENEINIFFDKKNYNLIGWQILDIYQNLSITYISNIIKNSDINENLFVLPKQN
ncbi:outer-membrane lipoprotein carrier protein LolA [Pelagibacterales bacterium SAG-MED47]|nr:outer-membrane lipoprotein carrier protein LolA [Pelagibacterales bacterium SAG-MED47]